MNGQWKMRAALALASLFGVNASGQSITNFTATMKPPSSSIDLRALSSTPCFTNLTVRFQFCLYFCTALIRYRRDPFSRVSWALRFTKNSNNCPLIEPYLSYFLYTMCPGSSTDGATCNQY
jgi:hypothetical protein